LPSNWSARVEPDVARVVDAVQQEREIVVTLGGVYDHFRRELLEHRLEHCIRVLCVEIVRPQEVVDDFLVGVQLEGDAVPAQGKITLSTAAAV